ncbi:hypothetical protein BO443_140152 [Burkholderia orbicola]
MTVVAGRRGVSRRWYPVSPRLRESGRVLHRGTGMAAGTSASKALRFGGRWITLCDAAAPDSRATRHVIRPGASGRRLSGPAGPLSRAPAAGP